MKAPPCFDDPEAEKVLKRICEENGIDLRLLKDLCKITLDYSGSGRADGVTADITHCIDDFVVRAHDAVVEG